MPLTKQNLKILERGNKLLDKPLDFLTIDGKTKSYIKQQFGTINQIKQDYTEMHFGMKGIKQAKQHTTQIKEEIRAKEQR